MIDNTHEWECKKIRVVGDRWQIIYKLSSHCLFFSSWEQLLEIFNQASIQSFCIILGIKSCSFLLLLIYPCFLVSYTWTPVETPIFLLSQSVKCTGNTLFSLTYCFISKKYVLTCITLSVYNKAQFGYFETGILYSIMVICMRQRT